MRSAGDPACADCNANGLPDACDPEFTNIVLFVNQLLADSQDPALVCVFDQTGDGTLNGADCQGFVDRLLIYGVTVETGACCLNFVDCIVLTQDVCELNNAVFQGNNTVCTPDLCAEPTGACCLSFGCLVLTQHVCELNAGTYVGDEVACLPDPCPAP